MVGPKQKEHADQICQTHRESATFILWKDINLNFLPKLEIILVPRLLTSYISLSCTVNENIRTLSFLGVNADCSFHVCLEYHATDISKFDPDCYPAEDRHFGLE